MLIEILDDSKPSRGVAISKSGAGGFRLPAAMDTQGTELAEDFVDRKRSTWKTGTRKDRNIAVCIDFLTLVNI